MIKIQEDQYVHNVDSGGNVSVGYEDKCFCIRIGFFRDVLKYLKKFICKVNVSINKLKVKFRKFI